ncbi:hypothetical protein H072_8177 [Dactylellina haptotyla CBS 200.50]|uniref:Uncharacterized protein n=1 Tax=Dactylellina haptotyla (strain CBS 200.50) TaxID=1284197 RepID=S8AAF9_DACHA|nr:hypothetical protein H072_8177 [Dactylellina haptotyla CBS 200.50]
MATLTNSVNSIVPATADLRKASVEQHRAKNRKMRYRNVNVTLLGQPIDVVNPFSDAPCKRWNDRNKFKMPNPNTSGGDSCQCSSCRSWRYEASNRNKARLHRVWDEDARGDNTYFYDALEQDNIYRDGVDGVLYSYDRPTGPNHGSQILTQALDIAIDKMERKQLEQLVKNEYDIVYSDESASSEDDEYEFV